MIVWQLILYCLLFTGMAAALVLIVELWVGRSGFWVIPELADLPYVQTWPQMLRKRALLSLVWVAGAALTAGLAVLLF